MNDGADQQPTLDVSSDQLAHVMPPNPAPRDPATVLREPANLVSPRAVGYWRLTAAISLVIFSAISASVLALWPDRPWWAITAAVASVALVLARVVVMPAFRYRVHRWEVTDTAIYTRSGWLSRTTSIAPLSRVQTVDSHQSALARPFRLASLLVTTASAAGHLSIDGLDEDEARAVVAHLVEVTGASQGDAT